MGGGGSGGETEAGKNRANGIGGEGDDAHQGTSGGADERQDIADARDEEGDLAP